MAAVVTSKCYRYKKPMSETLSIKSQKYRYPLSFLALTCTESVSRTDIESRTWTDTIMQLLEYENSFSVVGSSCGVLWIIWRTTRALVSRERRGYIFYGLIEMVSTKICWQRSRFCNVVINLLTDSMTRSREFLPSRLTAATYYDITSFSSDLVI